jgi:hypothetical protein
VGAGIKSVTIAIVAARLGTALVAVTNFGLWSPRSMTLLNKNIGSRESPIYKGPKKDEANPGVRQLGEGLFVRHEQYGSPSQFGN